MITTDTEPVNIDIITNMLKEKKRMRLFLSVCAACGMCADSCFLYRKDRDPECMPSYKAINSLGHLFRKKGKVKRNELIEMKKLIWGKCVMCGRCYCPLGIEIYQMIAWARAICRSQGVYERYDEDSLGV